MHAWHKITAATWPSRCVLLSTREEHRELPTTQSQRFVLEICACVCVCLPNKCCHITSFCCGDFGAVAIFWSVILLNLRLVLSLETAKNTSALYVLQSLSKCKYEMICHNGCGGGRNLVCTTDNIPPFKLTECPCARWRLREEVQCGRSPYRNEKIPLGTIITETLYVVSGVVVQSSA